MSGQTIAVLNTDAEGRLVLADALWYTQEKFKPQFMIDLATLTGAIIVALGHEHAGVFTNSDGIAKGLSSAGEAVDEPVWRFPLTDAYNTQIDSKIADMQNIGVRGAGSITAAQFLQRFTNDTPWAHIDIAGMAWRPNTKPTIHTWGTGYGVKLLNKFIADGYEKGGARKKTAKKAVKKKTAKKASKKATKKAAKRSAKR
jgi:leucyl aminopeptidase